MHSRCIECDCVISFEEYVFANALCGKCFDKTEQVTGYRITYTGYRITYFDRSIEMISDKEYWQDENLSCQFARQVAFKNEEDFNTYRGYMPHLGNLYHSSDKEVASEIVEIEKRLDKLVIR